MKKSKLIMPLVAIAAAGTTMIPLVSLASCGDKAEIADTKEKFLELLEDETVKSIKLTTDIEFTDADAYPIEIVRSKTIFCDKKEKHSIKGIFANSNISNKALFKIKNNDPGMRKLEVVFRDINLNVSATGWSTVISVSDSANTKLTIDHCNVGYDESLDVNCKRGDALTIEENNNWGIDEYEPCQINITNGSQLSGWSAIYNKGSNIKLTAKDSTFVGQNDYDLEGDNIFATIIMAEYPIQVGDLQRSFSANNDFTFTDCVLEARASEKKTWSEWEHQFVFECRSPANNMLHLDSATVKKSKSCNPDAKVWKNLFACAKTNTYSLNDTSIGNYKGADKPDDIKSYGEYLKYYTDDIKNLSQMFVDDIPCEKITDQSIVNYFLRTSLVNNSGRPHYEYNS